MEKLFFERRKYGKELLIDACAEHELDIVADTLQLTFHSIIFLEKSHGDYVLDGERIALGEHMVLFLQPGQVSGVGKAHFEKAHFLFFEADFLDEFFNDKNFVYKYAYFQQADRPAHLRLDTASFSKYYGLAQEIRQEVRQGGQDGIHILRALIYYLMVRLHQAYAEHYGGAQQTLGAPLVLGFLRLLDRWVREQKNIEQYAEALQISRVHLNQLCQKHFSKTATQVIRERLWLQIKKEVLYTHKDFSEIAYAFNFSAPSHFSRFVKQMSGLSPQALREAAANW